MNLVEVLSNDMSRLPLRHVLGLLARKAEHDSKLPAAEGRKTFLSLDVARPDLVQRD